MTFEIRILNDDDLPNASAITSYSFNAPNRDYEGYVERARRVNKPDWYLGSFEDGAMTAMMVMLPTEMYLNGATIPFGAVSPVATAPEHRRKGHAARLLRRSLELMKDRGQVISGLTTPHPALYRRFGWEIAADHRRYAFAPKDFAITSQPSQRGRFQMLKPEDWRELDRVLQRYGERHNGPFRRDQGWWQDMTLHLPWHPVSHIVLWRNDRDEAEGYALYNQPTGGPDEGKVMVNELVALSGDAYKNLALFFATHDISREIVVYGGPEGVLPLLFADAERIEIRERFTVMLRVCDFEAAMRLRPAARPDETAEVTLRIHDQDAPWNDGLWRVGVAEGRSRAERIASKPELTVEARVLGPLYNGYMKPSVAATAGLIEASDDDALQRADRVFAARQAPFFLDTF